MNKILRTFLAALMLAICGGSIVRAGPFEDGVAAYERGDYREAVKWYRLAANQLQINNDEAQRYNRTS